MHIRRPVLPVPAGGGSQGSSDVAWVREQTGLFAGDRLEVTVKRHTQVAGALIASDTGNLELKTKTLKVTDILDHDTVTSMSGQVSVSTPGA
jgi:hypothetical protein